MYIVDVKDSKIKPRGYWTKENCQKESLKYNSRFEYLKGSKGAYESSRRNGWLDDICSHMIEILKPRGYWTKENCQKESLKYKTRLEMNFRKDLEVRIIHLGKMVGWTNFSLKQKGDRLINIYPTKKGWDD